MPPAERPGWIRDFLPPVAFVTGVQAGHGPEGYGLRIRWSWGGPFDAAAHARALADDLAERSRANRKLYADTGRWNFLRRGDDLPTDARLKAHVAACLMACPALARFHEAHPEMPQAAGPFAGRPVPRALEASQVRVTACGPDGGTAEIMAGPDGRPLWPPPVPGGPGAGGQEPPARPQA
jgi:hypothetical protein